MANWAKNVLQVNRTTEFCDSFIDEKRVEAFFDSIKGKCVYKEEEVDLLIDFQKIVPFEIEEGDPDWKDKIMEAWGTECCCFFKQRRIDEYTIEFFTACRGVPELMKELSRQNPGIILNHTFNYGTGRIFNVASCVFLDGKELRTSTRNYGVDYTRSFFDKTVTHVTIPDGEDEIAKFAFAGYKNLKSVIIPDSVTWIGSAAFACCKNLMDITIHDNVYIIEPCAFLGTAWLNNQPDGIVYAGKVAYEYKGEMPKEAFIKIKEGTWFITDDTFSTFDGVDSIISLTVEIPDTEVCLPDRLFINGIKDFTEKVTIRCHRYSSAYKHAFDWGIRVELIDAES